jgi:predicted ester cyclase
MRTVTNLDGYLDSNEFDSERSSHLPMTQSRLSLVPIGRVHADHVQVIRECREAWLGLEARIRAPVEAFGSGVPSADDYSVACNNIPPEFINDVRRGGPRLRAAFPTLRRQVTAMSFLYSRRVLSVRLACEGEQVAAFFDLLSATSRCVQFGIVHWLVLDKERVVAHTVDLDIRDVLRQLSQRTRGR